LPRVRAGVLTAPKGQKAGRVRVIVQLGTPPLAQAFRARELAGVTSARRLDIRSRFATAYLARLNAVQRRAEAQLRASIPQARVSRRFRIVLDGLTVSVPVRKLDVLARLRFVTRVYPSLRYTSLLNRSPAVIGADEFHAATGAMGDGVKIGIVDDGVDPTNPFLRPGGLNYPVGFPRGNVGYTSPKVIVARSFPGPGSGKAGRLPVDRAASFHGTHVAGIAAGTENTDAPAGADHPAVTGLSGVAPHAWLGNYRVFTVPTPIGHVANTPEIVAAFEAAVADGMQVINFSGGGAQTDPANDAMVETVRNVVAAGVVPVIAAGNDRDDFGLGSVGSPGTVPDAISVAAVSNTHVFTPVLTVTSGGAPESLQAIPFNPGPNRIPGSWGAIDRTLIDVGTLYGNDAQPVDRYLCGPGEDPNDPTQSTLAPGSLAGMIALVSRGRCTFISKALRAAAAGAIGIVFVDNRPGEANFVPLSLPIPGGMISDLDGARIRAFAPQVSVKITTDIQQVETGRSGIVTSFSSAGPTDFGHDLKPDVAAPGGQILSSTLPEFSGGSPFAVFDGTSMATPHVTGAAALLLQVHPSWSPQEIKSALVATAGPAWANTARTEEAPVLLEGGGLINVARASDPKLFFDPTSLSFEELDVTRGAAENGMLVRAADAGSGAGTWTVDLRPQAATTGASVDVPGTLVVPPGGEATLPVVAHAAADAAKGENYGFLVLSRGDVTRRIPYAFLVSRPGLAGASADPLRRFQIGNTLSGESRVSQYCCPSEPFGPPPTYFGTPMNEDGAEHVYVTHVNEAVANIGVAVEDNLPGTRIDPFFLGSLDENDVQGYPGTPVNVNELMFDFRADVQAAGAEFPRQKAFYVSVDSGVDAFSGRRLAGPYLLRAWINDLRPPRLQLLTTRVSAGRPTIVTRAVDAGAGVDPLSLVIGYRRALVGAAFYDPVSGVAIFPLPKAAPTVRKGRTRLLMSASDFQETKNVNTSGNNIMPNTAFRSVRMHAVRGPALTWVLPRADACVKKATRLVVVASSSSPMRSVRFLDGRRNVAVDRTGVEGLFAVTWSSRRRGRHVLHAIGRDAGGRTVHSARIVRVCR
jgi:subtilisin family serine protease